MPAKKSIRMKMFAFWKPSKRRRKSSRLPWWKTTPALAGATICVLMSAVLIAAYQSAPATIAPAKTPTHMPHFAPSPESAAAAAGQAAADQPAPKTPKPTPVTITGCLERSDETFRLKDTEGENAPTSRSWKSGFLRKGRAPIAVVDAANRLKLSNHVGERIAVTGTLVDREMRVRSIQRVAASCSLTPRERV